jgi:hypothetical protein
LEGDLPQITPREIWDKFRKLEHGRVEQDGSILHGILSKWTTARQVICNRRRVGHQLFMMLAPGACFRQKLSLSIPSRVHTIETSKKAKVDIESHLFLTKSNLCRFYDYIRKGTIPEC